MLNNDPPTPISDQLWINKAQRKIKCFNNSETVVLSQTTINITITLTAQNISDKFITLSLEPENPSQVTVVPQGGPHQKYGIDFVIIDDNKISWDGLGLDGFLEVGEHIFISYS